jgi:16S rRNA (adenine1518-N6/adenine1519-N6)-dimethyltransferase
MTKPIPKKHFGQNFLIDRNIIEKIIASISPQDEDHIIEIGPGQGAITQYIAGQCNQLDIIEIDRDLVTQLQSDYITDESVIIHPTDALKVDLSAISTHFRIIGNLPYNISTPLLMKLIEFYPYCVDAHFMLQKELVDRICSPHGNKTYGRLSVIMQYYFTTHHLFNVKPSSFYPPPKVDSAILRLTKKERSHQANSIETFHALCRNAFSQRRKTLRNNLKNWLAKTTIDHIERDFDLSRRAETFSPDEFITISNLIESNSFSSTIST